MLTIAYCSRSRRDLRLLIRCCLFFVRLLNDKIKIQNTRHKEILSTFTYVLSVLCDANGTINRHKSLAHLISRYITTFFSRAIATEKCSDLVQLKGQSFFTKFFEHSKVDLLGIHGFIQNKVPTMKG